MWTGAGSAAGTGGDHLDLWRQILVDGNFLPLSGHYTLLRSALGGSVAARWLVGAKTSGERVTNAVGYAVWDAEERAVWEERSGFASTPRVAPAMTGAARLAELKDRRDAAGVQPKRRMGTSDLVRDHAVYGNLRRSDWLYRILSAASHGAPWALFAMEQQGDPLDGPVAGGAAMLIAASPKLTYVATRVVTDTFAAAVADLAAYLGREQPK